MIDYVAAVDDSGGVEPLVRWGGTFFPGDHPNTSIALILLRSDRVDAFNDQWNSVREEIRLYLGCNHLPPIHLRLMYGRQLPLLYRQKRNPYLDAPFEKVTEWVDKAFRVIQTNSFEKRTLSWFVLESSRERAAQPILRYFSNPALVAEMQFLKENSTQQRKSMAKRYLNKIASPLLPLLTNAILYLDVMMQLLGNKTVSLLVDRFSEAHGIDAIEVINAVNKVSNLRNIQSIQITSDGDELPLAQAADLIGFTYFRLGMARDGHIKPDLILASIARRRDPRRFITANVKHVMARHYSEPELVTRPIQYAVARRVVEEADIEFANTHLISVGELREQIRRNLELTGVKTGLSILRNPNICAHLIKPINGEDPR